MRAPRRDVLFRPHRHPPRLFVSQVNLFKENGTVIHFENPKVQASIPANTYVISGKAETKKLQDLLPGIINQLGPDNLANLKKIAENYSQVRSMMSKAPASPIPVVQG